MAPAAGRGGAGNIEEANKQISQDLEANQQDAETFTVPPFYTATNHEQYLQQKQVFAHMGRGGAGNYFSPVDLSETGVFRNSDRNSLGLPDQTTDDSATGMVRRKSGESAPVWIPSGRGGSGNFRSEREVEAEQERMADREEAEVRARVERDVELGLEKPGKAYLGGRETERQVVVEDISLER